jgi:hypothetical protein
MISLAALIYLVARAIPRIDENIVLSVSRKSFFNRIVSKVPLEKLDLMFNNLLEKILRKFKILVMKFDNVLTKWLSRFKPVTLKEKNIRPNIFNNSAKPVLDQRTEQKIEKREDDKPTLIE